MAENHPTAGAPADNPANDLLGQLAGVCPVLMELTGDPVMECVTVHFFLKLIPNRLSPTRAVGQLVLGADAAIDFAGRLVSTVERMRPAPAGAPSASGAPS